MLEVTRYVRRPFEIDAVQVTAENIEEVAKWCNGDVRNEGDNQYVKVRVHRPMNDKQTKAFVGDWVLYAGTGYKVYTSKPFKSSFMIKEGEAAVIVADEAPKSAKPKKATKTAVQRTPVHGDVTIVTPA